MTAPTQDRIVITGLGLVLPCGDGLEAARRSWDQDPMGGFPDHGVGGRGPLRDRAKRGAGEQSSGLFDRGVVGKAAEGGTQRERSDRAVPPGDISGVACFGELPANLGGGRGAACTSFNPSGVIPPMQLRRLDRPSRFAWVAAHQAFLDAGLDPRSGGKGERIGIAVGTLTGGSEASESFIRPYLEKGPGAASPMIFPNCVANAASGHVALAFGLNGPCTTQLEREGSTHAALDQACRWLRSGMADAMLVIGTDGLFPLQLELLRRTGRISRCGDPKANEGTGYLPGEGAQAFLLETSAKAESRRAKIRAEVTSVVGVAPLNGTVSARMDAFSTAVSEVMAAGGPTVWIGGSNGSRLDVLEAAVREAHSQWPAPRFPKLIWGEFCGAGGQLLAAALLQKADSALVSAPCSSGAQYAVLLRDVTL